MTATPRDTYADRLNLSDPGAADLVVAATLGGKVTTGAGSYRSFLTPGEARAYAASLIAAADDVDAHAELGTCTLCEVLDGQTTPATLLVDGHIPACEAHRDGAADGEVEAALEARTRHAVHALADDLRNAHPDSVHDVAVIEDPSGRTWIEAPVLRADGSTGTLTLETLADGTVPTLDEVVARLDDNAWTLLELDDELEDESETRA